MNPNLELDTDRLADMSDAEQQKRLTGSPLPADDETNALGLPQEPHTLAHLDETEPQGEK